MAARSPMAGSRRCGARATRRRRDGRSGSSARGSLPPRAVPRGPGRRPRAIDSACSAPPEPPQTANRSRPTTSKTVRASSTTSATRRPGPACRAETLAAGPPRGCTGSTPRAARLPPHTHPRRPAWPQCRSRPGALLADRHTGSRAVPRYLQSQVKGRGPRSRTSARRRAVAARPSWSPVQMFHPRWVKPMCSS